MRLRPVAPADLPALIELARGAGIGVTTLQPDAGRLARRIETSLRSFAGACEPAHANYFFVLEDPASGRLAGTSGIAAAVGLEEPWYNYRVGMSVSSSREIGVYRQLQTLFLTNDLTGASELCSLFLHADYRGGGNGGLLSRARLLYMADFPERFAPNVIAELRGISDANGHSPFWESLGRHFFRMDFSRADALTGIGNKGFIAELMPQYPLYTLFLSDAAQAVIGEVHPDTRPARAMLEAEGFSYQGYIDIFDAGPALGCPRDAMRSVRESRILEVVPAPDGATGAPWLVSNRKAQGFFATVVHALPDAHGRLPLTPQDQARLGVSPGETVRAVPVRFADGEMIRSA